MEKLKACDHSPKHAALGVMSRRRVTRTSAVTPRRWSYVTTASAVRLRQSETTMWKLGDPSGVWTPAPINSSNVSLLCPEKKECFGNVVPSQNTISKCKERGEGGKTFKIYKDISNSVIEFFCWTAVGEAHLRVRCCRPCIMVHLRTS